MPTLNWIGKDVVESDNLGALKTLLARRRLLIYAPT